MRFPNTADSFFVTSNCSRELFVWAVSDRFLLSQVKNVGAVSLLQIGLFLHKFLTALKRFPKHKLIFMRTDLCSLKSDIDRKAHRIELCSRFNSKLLRWQFWMFFSLKCAFQNENVGAVSLLQFELFLAHKSDTSRTGQYKSTRYITDLLRTHSGIRRTFAWPNQKPPDCTSDS